MKSLKKALLILSMLLVILGSPVAAVFASGTGGTDFTSVYKLSPGVSQTIPLFISNNDTAEHRYDLTAGGCANSYELYFASSGASIKNVTIPSGSNAQIDLNINLKIKASVNADKLIVNVVREDGEKKSINLALLINQDYALSVSSMLDKMSVLNGKSAGFTFSVTNNGSKDLNAVKMVPELPYKWIVSQGADATIKLKPGETGTLKMTVEVPSSQVAGNFTPKFTAVSNETISNPVSLPVTVKTSTNIAYWMVGALLLIVAATLTQFIKHGRR